MATARKKSAAASPIAVDPPHDADDSPPADDAFRGRFTAHPAGPLGLYAADIGRHRIQLSKSDEIDLHHLLHHGTPAERQSARETLIHAQLPWALRCAGKFIRRGLGMRSRLDMDELIQWASLAVIRSVEKFDPARGRLSTLVAASVERHLISQAFRYGHFIYVPPSAMKSEPSRGLAVAARGRCSVPLDALNPDTQHPTVPPADELAMDDRDLHDALLAAVDRLPERWRDVIRGRLRGETLKSVGERLGVGKERVRQIEGQAVERLRMVMRGNCDGV